MTATQPPLLSGDEQHTPDAVWPAGWYDDPADRAGKRYWDGSQWTQHYARPSTPAYATPPATTPASAVKAQGGGLYGWIRRRPAMAFWSTLGVALVVGMVLGAASAEQDKATTSDGDADRVSQLSSQLDETRTELDGMKGTLADTQDDLDTATDKLSTTREKLRDARAEAQATPTPAPAPAPTSPPADSGGSDSAKSFSGNGGKNIGTIKVSEESVLRWTNDGDIFQMWDDSFGMSVNSQAGSGDTVLQAGTYENVEVNAIGNWTIEIEPR
jgi:hypothetical protein